MSLRDLPHLGGLVFGTPLMIARPKLDTILNVLTLRLQDDSTTPPLPPGGTLPFVVTPSGVAILPVLGTLANRTIGLAAMSGLASYLRLGEQLDLAGTLDLPGFVRDPSPYLAVRWTPPKWDCIDR